MAFAILRRRQSIQDPLRLAISVDFDTAQNGDTVEWRITRSGYTLQAGESVSMTVIPTGGLASDFNANIATTMTNLVNALNAITPGCCSWDSATKILTMNSTAPNPFVIERTFVVYGPQVYTLSIGSPSQGIITVFGAQVELEAEAPGAGTAPTIQVIPKAGFAGNTIPDGTTGGTAIADVTTFDPEGAVTVTEIADPDNKFSYAAGVVSLSAAVDYSVKTTHSHTLNAAQGGDDTPLLTLWNVLAPPGGGGSYPAVIAANAWSQPVWDLINGTDVGYPSMPTKIPGVTATPTGMTVTNSSGGGVSWKVVNIYGPNLTYDGWDFRGCIVQIRGPGCTLNNNLFQSPAAIYAKGALTYAPYCLYIGLLATDNVADTTVEYNTFDADFSSKGATAIFFHALAARAIVRNNKFLGWGSDALKILSAQTSVANRPEVTMNYFSIGAWNNPAAHYDAITVGRGGAKIHLNHFNHTTFQGSPDGTTYGLNNAVRMQADVSGYVVGKCLVERNIIYGYNGSPPGGYIFHHSIRSGVTFDTCDYNENILHGFSDTGGYFHPQSSPQPTSFTNHKRFPDGAAIANPF